MVKWFVDNQPKYHTYNITSGKKIDLVSIAEKVNRISGKNVPVFVCREGLAKEYTADNRRLREEVPVELTEIDQGISALYKYYEKIESEIDILELLYQ